jgi:methyl-accepting chemotaxis protein
MAKEKGYISLKFKVSGVVVGSTLFIGAAMLFLIFTLVSGSLQSELIERGKAIAKSLSNQSAELILLGSEGDVKLKTLVEDAKRFTAVDYVFVIDNENNIRQSTFTTDFPAGLDKANIPSGSDFSIKENIKTQLGTSYDIASPVSEGAFGHVHVGMSKSYVDKEVRGALIFIVGFLIIAIVLGITLAFILANRITKPIIYLTESADKISMGDFETKIEVHSKDEIGDLAASVERMRESLKAAIERLRKRK